MTDMTEAYGTAAISVRSHAVSAAGAFGAVAVAARVPRRRSDAVRARARRRPVGAEWLRRSEALERRPEVLRWFVRPESSATRSLN